MNKLFHLKVDEAVSKFEKLTKDDKAAAFGYCLDFLGKMLSSITKKIQQFEQEWNELSNLSEEDRYPAMCSLLSVSYTLGEFAENLTFFFEQLYTDLEMDDSLLEDLAQVKEGARQLKDMIKQLKDEEIHQ